MKDLILIIRGNDKESIVMALEAMIKNNSFREDNCSGTAELENLDSDSEFLGFDYQFFEPTNSERLPYLADVLKLYE